MEDQAGFPWAPLFLVVAIIIGLILVWTIWLYPLWRVWAAHQEGLADLAQAKNEQAIQVAEAQGRKDAATLNKEAAIIEAEAVAAQIDKIGKELSAHDLYLRWQWIEMMKHRGDSGDTIYVPTEGSLPILEAGRFNK